MLSVISAATVVDLSAIPWATVLIILGAALTLLEARLVKGGFVKKDALDGLGNSLRARQDAADKERESLVRQFLMLRTDLDETRDRTTRTEAFGESMSARVNDYVVKPLSRIEEKLDAIMNASFHHEADIGALKEQVRRLEAERPAKS